MTAASITTLFAPGERITIATQVVTQAECDAVAAMARLMVLPSPSSRMTVENPQYPWEPCVWPEPIIMEPGRTPQEQAA